jgi:hypothetical protein
MTKVELYTGGALIGVVNWSHIPRVKEFVYFKETLYTITSVSHWIDELSIKVILAKT